MEVVLCYVVLKDLQWNLSKQTLWNVDNLYTVDTLCGPNWLSIGTNRVNTSVSRHLQTLDNGQLPAVLGLSAIEIDLSSNKQAQPPKSIPPPNFNEHAH